MLDELRLYSTNKDNKQLVKTLFDEFEAYSSYHFVAEERMMKKSEFPDYEQHMQQHLFFKQKINEFRNAFEYRNDIIDEQMLNFLRMWFVVHISEHDKQYADFIKLRHKK
jgi:hemerythrin